MSEFMPDKILPRINERYETKSKFVPDKMIVEHEKIDRNPNRLVKFTKTGESDNEKHMIHIQIENRHEYWESGVYEKHLQDLYCNRWHPYYVCYVYEK